MSDHGHIAICGASGRCEHKHVYVFDLGTVDIFNYAMPFGAQFPQ